MSRMIVFIVVVTMLTMVGSARPVLAESPRPTVDFRGDWVLTDDTGIEFSARLHYSADMQKMRVDLELLGMPMNGVRDMDTGETILWSDHMAGMGMRLPNVTSDKLDGDVTTETKTIGGETCTIWRVKFIRVCLTEENIPVETTAKGFTARLKNIERTEQDPALFKVPADLSVMEMPEAMLGELLQGRGLTF